MSRGTLIAYQGFRAQEVVFRRSRGYDADLSEVLFPVESFPAGFEVRAPAVDELLQPPDLVVPDLGAIRSGTPAAFAPRNRLDPAGTLVMAEVQDEEWQVVVHPLFVLRVDRVRQSETGRAWLRVVLADSRAFWGRGALRRWSFNRVRGDGSVALDSTNNGRPFTEAEVARQVVSALWGAPRLEANPERWTRRTGQVDFPRFCPPVLAMRQLCAEARTVDPCLRLDGTVALHREGEGFAGWAPQGRGPNTQPFPAHLRLSKQGQGQGYSIEQTYPDDYVIVAGGQRIASVRVDEWKLCLMIPRVVRATATPSNPDQGAREEELRFEGPEVPRLLDEPLVRELTKGRFGLDWLWRWIMQPQAYQHAVGLDPKVAKLFREQAGRLYWLPGAEANGQPGPNAHTLPLLARAETANGQRLPVTVECFRFVTQHRVMRDERELDQVAGTRQRRAALRDEITRTANVLGKPNPFTETELSRTADNRPLTAAELLGDLVGRLPGVSIEDLQNALNKLRTAERIKQLDQSLGGAWERELREEAKALDALNGTSLTELLDLATKLLQLDQAIEQDRLSSGIFETTSRLTSRREQLEAESTRRRREAFMRDVAEQLRAIARRQEELGRLLAIGGDTRALLNPQTAVFVRNLARDVDDGARVYSAQHGVVQTSVLAGHADPEGAPGPESCVFRPMPVRVTYGTTIRPLVNRSMPLTSQTRKSLNHVPAGLGDDVTWFVRVFKRTERGARPLQVDLDEVPDGEGTVITREDLVELVPLEGAGNGAELEQVAEELAAERFDVPTKVEEATYTLARPWPVQCDGVVSSVEIRSRDTPVAGTGFETVVRTNGNNGADPNPLRTRTRPNPPRWMRDSARREGLS